MKLFPVAQQRSSDLFLSCICSSLLSAGAAVPAEQVQEFTPGLRPISEIVRLGMFAVGEKLGGNAVGSSGLLYFICSDFVGPGLGFLKELEGDPRHGAP